ncbi:MULTISPECIES: hypothetical protein [unclassified Moraxella]|uniref:hypothetical protein n=1 Tax=unclassified Moraxella TaxID=2685852 RepID=UPI002B410E8B|nr:MULTISPECIES: hypothetical protein [unclassified Moraxella]
MADKASTQARKKATDNYFEKSLARISLVISHTEPQVLSALEKIIAHKDCSKAMAIKTALIEYAKSLD